MEIFQRVLKLKSVLPYILGEVGTHGFVNLTGFPRKICELNYQTSRGIRKIYVAESLRGISRDTTIPNLTAQGSRIASLELIFLSKIAGILISYYAYLKKALNLMQVMIKNISKSVYFLFIYALSIVVLLFIVLSQFSHAQWKTESLKMNMSDAEGS